MCTGLLFSATQKLGLFTTGSRSKRRKSYITVRNLTWNQIFPNFQNKNITSWGWLSGATRQWMRFSSWWRILTWILSWSMTGFLTIPWQYKTLKKYTSQSAKGYTRKETRRKSCFTLTTLTKSTKPTGSTNLKNTWWETKSILTAKSILSPK